MGLLVGIDVNRPTALFDHDTRCVLDFTDSGLAYGMVLPGYP